MMGLCAVRDLYCEFSDFNSDWAWYFLRVCAIYRATFRGGSKIFSRRGGGGGGGEGGAMLNFLCSPHVAILRDLTQLCAPSLKLGYEFDRLKPMRKPMSVLVAQRTFPRPVRWRHKLRNSARDLRSAIEFEFFSMFLNLNCWLSQISLEIAFKIHFVLADGFFSRLQTLELLRIQNVSLLFSWLIFLKFQTKLRLNECEIN